MAFEVDLILWTDRRVDFEHYIVRFQVICLENHNIATSESYRVLKGNIREKSKYKKISLEN